MIPVLPVAVSGLRFDRGLRAASWRTTLVSVLLIALVLVRASGLHLHSHARAADGGMVIHLADVASEHDALDGDVDRDLQGDCALHKLPSFGALPLAALPLIVTVLVLVPRSGGSTLPAHRRVEFADWRHRPETPPPAAAPPRR